MATTAAAELRQNRLCIQTVTEVVGVIQTIAREIVGILAGHELAP